jgi:hypothetical protein
MITILDFFGRLIAWPPLHARVFISALNLFCWSCSTSPSAVLL